MIHRLLLALLGCLLALAAPVSAHTTASRLPVVPTPVALFAVEFSDAQDCGPLTLHLDGLHHRAGPCGGVLVRQNPWSAFDPEGLSEFNLFGLIIGSAGVRVATMDERINYPGFDTVHARGNIQKWKSDPVNETVNHLQKCAQVGCELSGRGGKVGPGGMHPVFATAGAKGPREALSAPMAVPLPRPIVLNKQGDEVKPAGDSAQDTRKKADASADQATSKKWQPGDDPHGPTNRGSDPSDSTVRRREWKNEAKKPTRGDFTDADLDRMNEGKPPQRFNPDKGGVESMERSHEPIPKRDGGTKTEPKWPQEHAEVDPHRRPGY